MDEEPGFHELFQRAQGGDRDAAGALIQLYEPHILRLIQWELKRLRVMQLVEPSGIYASMWREILERDSLRDPRLQELMDKLKFLKYLQRAAPQQVPQGISAISRPEA